MRERKSNRWGASWEWRGSARDVASACRGKAEAHGWWTFVLYTIRKRVQ